LKKLSGVVTLTLLQESSKGHVRSVTRGVYPILVFPLFFSLFFFVMAIYVWNIVAILIALLWLIPMLFGSVAEIGVRDDGIIVKRIIFGTSYWNFDEIKFTAGGRILEYGGLYGGWIMPFKWRKCVEAIKDFRQVAPSQPRRAPSKVRPLIYLLVPPIMLWIIGNLAGYFEFLIQPLAWALLWGVTATFSIATSMYTAPIKFKVASLGKAESSSFIGSVIGTIMFFFYILITS